VSFQPAAEIANQADRFLQVAWLWRAGASASVAACELADEDKPGDTQRYTKHKMTERN